MKIGKLVSRNGLLHWKSNHEPTCEPSKDAESIISRFSKAGSHMSIKSGLSVMTPQIEKSHARSNTFKSSAGSKYHMANPNPQIK